MDDYSTTSSQGNASTTSPLALIGNLLLGCGQEATGATTPNSRPENSTDKKVSSLLGRLLLRFSGEGRTYDVETLRT